MATDFGQKDGLGLNKAERLRRKREEQAEEERKKALPLDPPFPFGVAPFDPWFFEVTPSAEISEGD